MNVVVASAHRNSAGNARRYMQRVAMLRDRIAPASVRVIAAEGDSTDNTRAELMRHAADNGLPIHLVDATHGHPPFGSTESPIRMVALSGVANRIFDSIRLDDDMLVYVESDLIWHAPTIEQLLSHAYAQTYGYDVFAPLVMAGDLFYDVWAYRDMDGNRFGPFPPFHHRLNGKLMQVSSAGSCLVMRSAVARECRIHDGNALVGWCHEARRMGYRIAVDPTLIINHPA